MKFEVFSGFIDIHRKFTVNSWNWAQIVFTTTLATTVSNKQFQCFLIKCYLEWLMLHTSGEDTFCYCWEVRQVPHLSSHAQISIWDSKCCCTNSLYQLVLTITFLTSSALYWVWEAEPLSFLCYLPRQSALHISLLNTHFNIKDRGADTPAVCPSWSTATINNTFTSLGCYIDLFPMDTALAEFSLKFKRGKASSFAGNMSWTQLSFVVQTSELVLKGCI